MSDEKSTPKTGISRKEVIIAETDNGYLFHVGDGLVKYRSDQEHKDWEESKKFQEPSPRQGRVLA